MSRMFFVIMSTLDEQTDCLLTDMNKLHFRVEVGAHDVARALHLDLELSSASLS